MIREIEITKYIFSSCIKDKKDIDWETIVYGFAVFVNDPKPLYGEIYKLELDDPEEIISKLPELHELFVEELAEAYVINKSSITIIELLESPFFNEKVRFFRTLKNVLVNRERKRIIQELPEMAALLDFSLSENEIKSAIKKKARTELKSNFKDWDKQVQEAPNVLPNSQIKEDVDADISNYYVSSRKQKSLSANLQKSLSANSKKEVKVISLFWIKYAVAAIFVLGFFVWQPTQNTNVELFAYYSNNVSSYTSAEFEELDYQPKVLSRKDYKKNDKKVEKRDIEYRSNNYAPRKSENIWLGLKYFNEGNFDKGKEILLKANVGEKSPKLLIFLAISQLNTNEIDKAISNLEFLKNLSDFEYLNDVSFHLAMAYIEKNKRDKAKFLLKELIKTDNKFTDQSKEILKKMRWF